MLDTSIQLNKNQPLPFIIHATFIWQFRKKGLLLQNEYNNVYKPNY